MHGRPDSPEAAPRGLRAQRNNGRDALERPARLPRPCTDRGAGGETHDALPACERLRSRTRQARSGRQAIVSGRRRPTSAWTELQASASARCAPTSPMFCAEAAATQSLPLQAAARGGGCMLGVPYVRNVVRFSDAAADVCWLHVRARHGRRRRAPRRECHFRPRSSSALAQARVPRIAQSSTRLPRRAVSLAGESASAVRSSLLTAAADVGTAEQTPARRKTRVVAGGADNGLHRVDDDGRLAAA
jgi:hypothetical protein